MASLTVATFGPRLQYIVGWAVYLPLIPRGSPAEQFGLIPAIDQIDERGSPTIVSYLPLADVPVAVLNPKGPVRGRLILLHGLGYVLVIRSLEVKG